MHKLSARLTTECGDHATREGSPRLFAKFSQLGHIEKAAGVLSGIGTQLATQAPAVEQIRSRKFRSKMAWVGHLMPPLWGGVSPFIAGCKLCDCNMKCCIIMNSEGAMEPLGSHFFTHIVAFMRSSLVVGGVRVVSVADAIRVSAHRHVEINGVGKAEGPLV